MRVSPLDIRKQTFKRVMRGADPEEVRNFLDFVASEFEKVLQENAMMAERLRTQEARLSEFRQLEESMRNSLVTAERIASEARESSEREARRLVQDAHLRAERILEDARERLQILIREIELLRGKKEVFARRFWTLIESQISVLQEHMGDSIEVESLRQQINRHLADAKAATQAEEQPIGASAAAPEPARASPAIGLESPASGGEEPAWTELAATVAPADGVERTGGHGDGWPPFGARDFETAPANSAGVWDGDRPDARAGAGAERPRSESAPARSSSPRSLPKGLGRLLRGRQTTLPLHPVSGSREGAASEPRRGDGLSGLERREGFFELRASEDSREETGARFRGNGPAERD